MHAVMEDVRASVRQSLKNPAVALAVILTTALSVGMSTAIFSVVHGVLMSPLPYPEPDRLTFIWKDFSANFQKGPLSPRELVELRRTAFHYQAIGGIWSVSGTLLADNRPEPLRVGRVTSNFFDVLGVTPVGGRGFTAEDERAGPPSMVISYELWQRRFGGSDVIGRRFRIGGGWGMGSNEYTLIGIMPAGFEMLLPDPSVPPVVDAWVPFQGTWATGSGSMLRSVGRLAPGATLAAAQEQVEAVGRASGASTRLYAVPLHDELVQDARPALVVLQAAVVCTLLVACISVAGLLLVSAQRRRKEMAIRAVLGAPSRRLVGLVLTEALILAAAGGLLGIAVAYGGIRLLPLLDSGMLPRGSHASLNTPVLAFSAAVSLASGLIFGLAPLRDVRRTSFDSVLRDGTRTSARAMRDRTRSILLVAEIAFSVLLLIGGGLLARTFLNLYSFNPGFSGERVLAFRLLLPGERYNPEAAPTFPTDLEHALRAVPGVESAGVINQLPLDDEPNYGTSFWTRETVATSEAAPLADVRIVSPGYFETIRAELTAGRWLTEEDNPSRPLAIVVDERLARRAWPGRNPVGQDLLLGSRDGAWGRVVGVVRHLRHHRLTEEVREQVFVTYAQRGRSQMSVVVRSPLDAEALLRGITARLSTLDRDLVPARAQPLNALLARSRSRARLSMVLAGIFAGFSLLLASLSLYAVIAYSITERKMEFGIRSALGASAADLMRMVLRQGLVLAGMGIALGVGVALATTPLVQRLLFGVAAFDRLTFASVPITVGVTTLLACYLPARRAANVDPMLAIRGT